MKTFFFFIKVFTLKVFANPILICAVFALSKTISYAESKPVFNGKLQTQIKCILKPASVNLVANLDGQSLEIKLPVNTVSNFKLGKEKGCDAVLKHTKLAQQGLPQKVLKNLASGYKVIASLPSNENGMQFELSYDLFIFKKADGQLSPGPVVLAGGLENSVENEVLSATAAEIIIKQSSSGEGEPSEEKIVFKYQADKWIKAASNH